MPPSSPESSGKPGSQDSHTRPGPCPWAPQDHRGNSADISSGEGPTRAAVRDSRIVGTAVQTESGGRRNDSCIFCGYTLSKEKEWGLGQGTNLKVLRAKATGVGRVGQSRVLGRKIPGSSEAIHLHCLGQQPVQSPVGQPKRRLDPGPLYLQDAQKDKHSQTYA